MQVFGPNDWYKKLNTPQYHPESLFEQDYANACFSAKGILNFLRPQNIMEQSHNMRTFEVPAYGGLLISNRTEEQLQYFEDEKEVIYFDDINELYDKLTFYKKNNGLLERIKTNGKNRSIKSGYSYSNRSLLMIQFITNYLD